MSLTIHPQDPASILDSPLFTSVAFHPRAARAGSSKFRGAVDGSYDAQDAKIGFRLFRAAAGSSAVICHFHGNAEVCSDADLWAPKLVSQGISVLAVDFRGYGWGSRSAASLRKLCPDAKALATQLESILKSNGINDPRIVLYGRSIGSLCAVHLASQFPKKFVGLVIECGLASLLDLPMVIQLASQMMGQAGLQMLKQVPDVFQQEAKLRSLKGMKVLVIHGTRDTIIPVKQAQILYAACGVAATEKQLVILKGAGHNDIQMHAGYSSAVEGFFEATLKMTTSVAAAPAVTMRSDEVSGIPDAKVQRGEDDAEDEDERWCRCM